MLAADDLPRVAWPAGSGTAFELVRDHDWSTTLLGASDAWSETLRSVVDLALGCSYPMIVLWGPDLVQIYNESYGEILGGKHPRALGQTTRECWGEVWHINEPIYARVFAGETVTFVDQMYPILRHGYREEAYFNLCFSPLRDAETKVAGVLVTVFDSTREIREQLAREQRKAMLEQLRDPSGILPDTGQLIGTATRLLTEQLGCDRAVFCRFEADERTFKVVSAAFHPDAPIPAHAGRLLALSREAGDSLRGGLRHVQNTQPASPHTGTAGGKRVANSLHAQILVPLQRGGRLVAAIGVEQETRRVWQPDEIELVQEVADHTWQSLERARAETELRRQWHTFDTVLSHTLDFIYVLDLDGRFTYANRALLDLWRISLKQAIGKNFFDLNYPPDLARRLQGQIEDVIRTKVNLRDETPFSGPEQSERIYEYLFVPVLDDSGSVRLVAGSTRDITEHREAEAAISASLIERETLLKEIHHRVKNNLQVIVSLLGLQSDHITDPAALAAFLDTQGRVRAIARIHETLYSSADLAEVEFGHYARVLVEDILAFYNVSPRLEGLIVDTDEMVLNVDQAIPLGLILNELLTNALRHGTPQGGAARRIEVGLHYLRNPLGQSEDGAIPEDAEACLSIRDNGPGLPAEIDLATTSSMGLYLVRVLTRQLHGRVALEPGSGRAAFRVTFPSIHFHPQRQAPDRIG